jgi:hypothetical protein
MLGAAEGVLLDPFVGVATTGSWAIQSGYSFRGIETHPFVAEIASLKVRPVPKQFGQRLLAAADAMVGAVKGLKVKTGLETPLVRHSFSQATLADLVALREMIDDVQAVLKPYLRCALAATLRDVASVKVGWPYQRPTVARTPVCRAAPKRFRDRVQWLADDLTKIPLDTDAKIVAGDARKRASWQAALRGAKATACLSSPPYLNNFDYADATRLEVYFFGIARSWSELCEIVRADMVAATTQQSVLSRANSATIWLEKEFPQTAAESRKLCERLSEQRRLRPRGKEYDQTLPAYLADIAAVLRNAYEFLETDARLAWVIGDSAPYGVYIDTPTLISQLAVQIGFTPIENLLLRPRGLRWGSNGTRHKMALAERLIVFRRA